MMYIQTFTMTLLLTTQLASSISFAPQPITYALDDRCIGIDYWADLYLYECNGDSKQLWSMDDSGVIRNEAEEGKCLTVDGVKWPKLKPCTSAANQIWTLILMNGDFNIKNGDNCLINSQAISPNHRLTVEACDSQNDAFIVDIPVGSQFVDYEHEKCCRDGWANSQDCKSGCYNCECTDGSRVCGCIHKENVDFASQFTDSEHEKCCVDGWAKGQDCKSGCYNCVCADESRLCGCAHKENIECATVNGYTCGPTAPEFEPMLMQMDMQMPVSPPAMNMEMAEAESEPLTTTFSPSFGPVTITYGLDGRCIGVDTHTDLYLYECNGESKQLWSMDDSGVIRNHGNAYASQDICLTADQGKWPKLRACTGATNQIWTLASANAGQASNIMNNENCLLNSQTISPNNRLTVEGCGLNEFIANEAFIINTFPSNIGWTKLFFCAEGRGEEINGLSLNPAYTEAELRALLPYAISMKILPNGNKPGIFEEGDFAVTAHICNPSVIAINNGKEASFHLDSELVISEYQNIDTWYGTNSARNRLNNQCMGGEARDIFDEVFYHACGNVGGFHIIPQSKVCEWDHADSVGRDIEVWIGYDITKTMCCSKVGVLSGC